MRVLVLAGGPDHEREVSLKSGAAVAAALRQAGHDVTESDIGPGDLATLDALPENGVVFPALHGAWGEGGPLQAILQQRGLRYVGSGPAAAELAMDKQRTKKALHHAGVPTPPSEVLRPGDRPTLAPPAVVKPVAEGSSIALTVCQDPPAIEAAAARVIDQYGSAMVERYIAGPELTVGVLSRPGAGEPAYDALPAIQIVPATGFYDYQAKYDRDDTRYLFDIDLPDAVLARVRALALSAHRAVGARHLSRVDFMIDAAGEPWVLEVNTMPGFTDHSLLPKAAARAGIAMPELVDRLVRLA